MGKGPCLWSGGLAKPEFFIEDYDDVGDDDYDVDVDVIDDVCDVDAYGAEVQQNLSWLNEVYDDVGDEYDNDEDEDCVDIDPVEARPELSVIVF